MGYLAIGASTLRNQGAPQVIETARLYLQGINLNLLKKINSESQYLNFINRHTNALSNKVPAGAKGNWGAARKAINIFMRDCLYNQYLTKQYGINKLEEWLEVPLDKDVANNIIKGCNCNLHPWKSIKSLDKDTSDRYQVCAYMIAKKEKIPRVHLDIIYWREGKYATNKKIHRTQKARR